MLLHHLYAVLFLKWAVFGWHFALTNMMICLLLPLLVESVVGALPRSTHALTWAVVYMLIIAVGGLYVFRRDWGSVARGSWRGVSYDTALWVREHLPADAILAMHDSGYMGLFSERRVVNLDGMVNGFAFQDSLRRGRFAEFLERSGVRYYVSSGDRFVVDHAYQTRRLVGWSFLYDVSGGSVPLWREDELYRSPPYTDGGRRLVAVVWRIRSS